METDAACLKPFDGEAAVGVDYRWPVVSLDREAFIRVACPIAQRSDAGLDHHRLELVSGRGVGALDDHEAADARAQKGLQLDAAHIIVRDFKLRRLARITRLAEILHNHCLITSGQQSGELKSALPVSDRISRIP